MKREPMGNEREPDSWLGTTLRQIAGSGVRCVSRRRDAGCLGRWRAERHRRPLPSSCMRRAARGAWRCWRRWSAALPRIRDARVDAGARVPLARAADGGRDRRGHLDCGAGSADHPGGTSARSRSGDSSTGNSVRERGTGNRNLSWNRGTPTERGTRNPEPEPSTQHPEPRTAGAGRLPPACAST